MTDDSSNPDDWRRWVAAYGAASSEPDLDRPPAAALAADRRLTQDAWIRRVPYALGASVLCFFLFPVALPGSTGFGLALLGVAAASWWFCGRGTPRSAHGYVVLAAAPVLLLLLLWS